MPVLATTTAASTIAAAAGAAFTTPGVADMLTSLGSARIGYDDAAELTELWPDLSAWSATGLTVTAAKVYMTSAAGFGAAARALTIPNPGRGRVFGLITAAAIAGSGTQVCAIGFDTGTAGATPGSALPATFYGVGINITTGRPVSIIAGVMADLAAGSFAARQLLLSVTVDETSIGMTISTTDGTVEFSARTDRPAGAINNVLVTNTDTRAATGNYLQGLSAKASQASMRNTAVERSVTRTVTQTYPKSSSTQRCRISAPGTYDSRRPLPLVLWCHGSGQTETQSVGANNGNVEPAIVAAGCLVAASNMHGTNWGNSEGIADLVDLYRYCRDHYPLGPVVLVGQSMGGLASLNALATRAIPNVVGFVGIYPVTNLAAMHTAGLYTSVIRTAYGIAGDGSDYASKTAGFDPGLRKGVDFKGISARIYHSAADTQVAKADSDAFVARIAPYAREATVQATTGDHGDASNFQPSDVAAFIARTVTAVL